MPTATPRAASWRTRPVKNARSRKSASRLRAGTAAAGTRCAYAWMASTVRSKSHTTSRMPRDATNAADAAACVPGYRSGARAAGEPAPRRRAATAAADNDAGAAGAPPAAPSSAARPRRMPRPLDDDDATRNAPSLASDGGRTHRPAPGRTARPPPPPPAAAAATAGRAAAAAAATTADAGWVAMAASVDG
jgi:hypothetical protein